MILGQTACLVSGSLEQPSFFDVQITFLAEDVVRVASPAGVRFVPRVSVYETQALARRAVQVARNKAFARLVKRATLAEIESWVADMRDPESTFWNAPDWKHALVRRRYLELTGVEL